MIEILQLNPKENWKVWIDFEGNYIRISRKNSLRIFLQKKSSEKCVENLLIKATPDIIAKHSYLCYYMESENAHILSFLGNDGVLRSCYFVNDIWKKNIAPIKIGLDNLKFIVKNYLDEKKTAPNYSCLIDFDTKLAFLTELPESKIQCLLEKNKKK